MLETPHVLVAAAIAVRSPNPAIAISLSLLSHFVLDKTPHWNPHFTTKEGGIEKINKKTLRFIFADSFVALLSGTGIAVSFYPDFTKMAVILTCCFAAVLPDLIEAPYIFLNYRRPWLKKWLSFQKRHQHNTGVVWGTVTQIVIIIAAVGWMV